MLSDDVEVEKIHPHPENRSCGCCQNELTALGSQIVREEAEFILAKMQKTVHIEHAYKCKKYKRDINEKAQIKKGSAPSTPIMRSIAGSSVLVKVIHDKFILYLPLYFHVEEWKKYGLETNNKSLSNWVIRAAQGRLMPIYEVMHEMMKSIPPPRR